MKITIIGPGAIGLVLASSLENKNEVSILVKRNRYDELNRKGLWIIKNDDKKIHKKSLSSKPLSQIIGDLKLIDWKTVYKGFKEFKIALNDKDSVKLIKMDPGTSVPLHSHNDKEYILVLDGSFCDEYGEYNKGDMQINDQQIKHNPTACKSSGCVCLSITENDVVFFGKYGSALNLFTFIKSFFK